MPAHRRVVPTSYYRMSSILTIEAARQRLIGERHQSPTRVLGYANRHILRVDHRAGDSPDRIIHEIDPAARLLPTPPPKERLSMPQATGTGRT